MLHILKYNLGPFAATRKTSPGSREGKERWERGERKEENDYSPINYITQAVQILTSRDSTFTVDENKNLRAYASETIDQTLGLRGKDESIYYNQDGSIILFVD